MAKHIHKLPSSMTDKDEINSTSIEGRLQALRGNTRSLIAPAAYHDQVNQKSGVDKNRFNARVDHLLE